MDFITSLRIFIQNLTPIQAVMLVGAVLFLTGLWFFSDQFNNKTNALVFTFAAIALGIFLYIGYHLLGAALPPVE